MTIVALLQNRYPVLNAASDENLHGLEAQVYHNFFEALEEKHNHIVLTAESLAAYQSQNNPAPDIVICAPLPDEGNVAPGLDALRQIREAFPRTPIIVWSTRTEESLRKTCLDDLGCAAYYTGTLLEAPEDLPRLIASTLP